MLFLHACNQCQAPTFVKLGSLDNNISKNKYSLNPELQANSEPTSLKYNSFYVGKP